MGPVRHAPLALILLRLILGPVMVLLALSERVPAAWIVACLWFGVLSDIFDGIIARRLGVATPRLRRLDSHADLVLFLCALAATTIRHPGVMQSLIWPGAVLIALEAATHVLSLVRIGLDACAHPISAKVYALALLASLTCLIGWGAAGPVFWFTFICGVLCNLEIVLILLVLPRWEPDVPGIRQAVRLRRGLPIQRNPLFN